MPRPRHPDGSVARIHPGNDESARSKGASEVQLWGACSNPEVVLELERMIQAASAVARDQSSQLSTAQPLIEERPGWVAAVVIAVLAASRQPLRPRDVVRQAERTCGRRLAASSVRNALRVASKHDHGSIERVAYGMYRFRRDTDGP